MTQCSVHREAMPSLGDALRNFLLIPTDGQRQIFPDSGAHSRKLQGLEGELVMLGNWTCEDGCLPPHEREDRTPGVHNRPWCVENSNVASLHMREDLDLGCLDSNITCEDIEANETLRNPQPMYGECTLDPELLQGECSHFCRFQRHPTRRCEYWFDRNNKYGMHGREGMYGFGHCVWYSGCPDDIETVMAEENYLVCNTTRTHEIIHSTTTTLSTTEMTSTSTTTLARTMTTTLSPVPNFSPTATASSSASEESGDFGIGVVIGAAIGGGVLVCILASLIAFCMIRRKRAKETYSEDSMQTNGTVVVGRPVPGVAPPAGHGKKSADDGNPECTPDEKVAQGQQVEP